MEDLKTVLLLKETKIKSSLENAERAAQLLEQAAKDLRREADNIRRGEKGEKPFNNVPASERLSWMVNTIANIMPNLRLDLFVTRAAELAQLDERQRKFF